MQIDKPTWYFKKICPCCEQGFPYFVVCPNCNYLTIRCEEMEDTFLDVKNLELGFAENCPNCNQTKTRDFLKATSDDIMNAGFTKDDYE